VAASVTEWGLPLAHARTPLLDAPPAMEAVYEEPRTGLRAGADEVGYRHSGGRIVVAAGLCACRRPR